MKPYNRVLLAALFLLPVRLFAQAPTVPSNPEDTMHFWKHTALAALNFNQAGLTNWQGGGLNTIAISAFIHASSCYKRNGIEWVNKLDAAYGQVKLGGAGVPFQKSDDELRLSSTYGHAIAKQWNIVVSLDAKTTFAPGYKYGKDSLGNVVRQEKLSQFLSPAYILLGAGIEFKPSPVFAVLLAPLTGRFTIIANDSMANVGLYGVPAGKHLRAEIGEELKIGLNIPVMTNVTLASNLDMFGNYKHVQQQVIDWTVDLTLKVNSLLTAKVGTDLIYDQDVKVKRDNGTTGPAVQFKEVIAVGIQYKLY